MKDHVDAAERQRTGGSTPEAVGLTFGEAITTCREQLQEAAIRPNTKAYREAGLKLVLRSWENVEALNVRRITSKMVEEWHRRFKATAKPHVPRGRKDSCDKLNRREYDHDQMRSRCRAPSP
jgi:hypothetical protein